MRARSVQIIVLALAIATVAAGSKFVGVKEDLRRQREAIDRQWSRVETALQRRADVIPSLVEAVDDDRSENTGAEDGDRSEDDEQAPHDGGSRYPGCVIVPSRTAIVSPAELVARRVACHVPGGTASSEVPLVGRRPRSTV